MRIGVIGVGSLQGDDAVGLFVAERLREGRLPAGVSVTALDRPGVALVEVLGELDAAIIVDAVSTRELEWSPGTVIELDPAQLRRVASASSHGLGVADALKLAAALEREPRIVRIVGVSVTGTIGAGLSGDVEEAVETACQRVRAIVMELTAAPAAVGAMSGPRR
jgi:hydrogenase maturation protease